jgi:hypothetical protein
VEKVATTIAMTDLRMAMIFPGIGPDAWESVEWVRHRADHPTVYGRANFFA